MLNKGKKFQIILKEEYFPEKLKAYQAFYNAVWSEIELLLQKEQEKTRNIEEILTKYPDKDPEAPEEFVWEIQAPNSQKQSMSTYNPMQSALEWAERLATENIQLRYPEVSLRINSEISGRGEIEIITLLQNATGSRLILVRDTFAYQHFKWKMIKDLKKRFKEICLLHKKNFLFTSTNSIAEPHKNLIRKI